MRIMFEVTDEQGAELKRRAGLIPLSRWIRAQLFPQGEELAVGEASARSNDTPAARRLPKAAKPQKSIPAELPNWGVGKEASAAVTVCHDYPAPR